MGNRHKLKINNKAIVIVFTVLIVVISVAAYLNYSSSDNSGEGYQVAIAVKSDSGTSKVVKTYSLKEIKNMKTVDIYVKLLSSAKGDEEGTFTGVPVKTILDNTDKSIIKKHENYIFTAGDGYSAAATKKEIKEKNNAIVAFAKDGKNMEHFNEGGSGPMRVIFAKDTYGNRGTKFLIKITCN